MNGEARSRLTPDFTAGSAVIAAAAGSAALLGAVAVHSPKYAVLALLAAAFVALAMSRLALAVAAFIVLTFPEHLPGSFGAGATLAKPVGALLVLAWGAIVLTRRVRVPLLPRRGRCCFRRSWGFFSSGASRCSGLPTPAKREPA